MCINSVITDAVKLLNVVLIILYSCHIPAVFIPAPWHFSSCPSKEYKTLNDVLM